jgi:hypothetical protein
LEALEAAGSGSNLGFNYSHLEKQDKNELFGLKYSTKKNNRGSRSAGAHRRGPADFFVFPNPRKTSIQLLWERWSFLLIFYSVFHWNTEESFVQKDIDRVLIFFSEQI